MELCTARSSSSPATSSGWTPATRSACTPATRRWWPGTWPTTSARPGSSASWWRARATSTGRTSSPGSRARSRMRRAWRSWATPTSCRSTSATGPTRRSRACSPTTATCGAAATLDMKGEVAARAVALKELVRSGWRPRGDLWFLAVADEEDGMAEVGMNWLLRARPDIRPDMSVNEGGGERFELTDGRTLVSVGVGEKGTYPARVTAVGEAGHGSLPTLGDNAVPHLGELIARIGRGLPAPVAHPLVDQMLEVLLGDAYAPGDDLPAALAAAGALHPELEHVMPALAGTTMAPTMLGGSDKRNTQPSRAWVELDCRILPGTTEADVEAAVRDAAGRRHRLRADVARAAHPRQRLAPRRTRRAGDPRVGGRRAAGLRAAAEPRHRLHRLVVPPRGREHGGVRLLPVLHHPDRGATSPGSTTPTSGCTSTTCTPRSASTSTSRRRSSHEGPRPRHRHRHPRARRARRDHRRPRRAGRAHDRHRGRRRPHRRHGRACPTRATCGPTPSTRRTTASTATAR